MLPPCLRHQKHPAQPDKNGTRTALPAPELIGEKGTMRRGVAKNHERHFSCCARVVRGVFAIKGCVLAPGGRGGFAAIAADHGRDVDGSFGAKSRHFRYQEQGRQAECRLHSRRRWRPARPPVPASDPCSNSHFAMVRRASTSRLNKSAASPPNPGRTLL